MRIRDMWIARFFLGIGSHSRGKRLAAQIEAERVRSEAALEVSRRAHANMVAGAHKKYLSYPVKEMTREQFNNLPKGENMGTWYPATCLLGSWFVFNEIPFLPSDKIVVGQVVSGINLLADQWAGLSIPERGINRYRLVII